MVISIVIHPEVNMSLDKNVLKLTKEFLEDQIVNKCKSISLIAKQQNVGYKPLLRHIKKLDISVHGAKARNDLLDKKFGLLTVKDVKSYENPKTEGKGRIYWICECECGYIGEYTTEDVKTMSSCGCLYRGGRKYRDPKFLGYEGLITYYWRRIVYGAGKRGLELSITAEYAWNLFLKQSGKCALTGVVITLPKDCYESIKGISTASLDRIDSSKGYVEGNIQWTHKQINKMKMSFSQDILMKWCKTIYEYNHLETA